MSIKVTFPDGAVREYSRGTTGTTIVDGISRSLARNTVAMKWNGVLSDLSDPLNEDGRIEFVLRDALRRVGRLSREDDTAKAAPLDSTRGALSDSRRAKVRKDREDPAT